LFQCSSKILAAGKGNYEETEPTELHVMHKKLESQGVEKEFVKQVKRTGAHPTTFEFTATTPAL
jgi:hypothetical protein